MNWSWLAGFVDGDGSIGVFKNGGKNKLAPAFTPTLAIYNTYRPLMKRLEKELGGYLYRSTYHAKTQKPMYSLKFTGNPARQYIKEILPHLQIKAEVAKLALTFPKRNTGGKKGYVNSKGLERQMKVFQEIKNLNRRGA